MSELLFRIPVSEAVAPASTATDNHSDNAGPDTAATTTATGHEATLAGALSDAADKMICLSEVFRAFQTLFAVDDNDNPFSTDARNGLAYLFGLLAADAVDSYARASDVHLAYRVNSGREGRNE